MAQMKDQIKTPEKERSNTETANWSERVFKKLVIRMLRNDWVWPQIKEEMKALQNANKIYIWWTNSEGKETRTQINDLEQKEEISIQPEQNEEQEFKKWGEA